MFIAVGNFIAINLIIFPRDDFVSNILIEHTFLSFNEGGVLNIGTWHPIRHVHELSLYTLKCYAERSIKAPYQSKWNKCKHLGWDSLRVKRGDKENVPLYRNLTPSGAIQKEVTRRSVIPNERIELDWDYGCSAFLTPFTTNRPKRNMHFKVMHSSIHASFNPVKCLDIKNGRVLLSLFWMYIIDTFVDELMKTSTDIVMSTERCDI